MLQLARSADASKARLVVVGGEGESKGATKSWTDLFEGRPRPEKRQESPAPPIHRNMSSVETGEARQSPG